jgi:hypothetical protein
LVNELKCQFYCKVPLFVHLHCLTGNCFSVMWKFQILAGYMPAIETRLQ